VRALILSSHPLADWGVHKAELLAGLVEREIEVTVLYGGTRLRDYTRELRRRAPTDVRKLAQGRASSRSGTGADSGTDLQKAAQELGVRVLDFPTLQESRALRFVSEFEPDIVLNLSALYIPPAFLDATDKRVVGAHYAELPRLRGSDTIRWSILLDVPLHVSHQVLTSEFDMGDVVGRTVVDVERGDDVAGLRRKCQRASVTGYLDVVESVRAGTLERRPQQRSDGSTFFRMGTFLRAHVDRLLSRGHYSHYISPS
jgi:methionyl-tRNA formyltransferase